MRGLAGPVPGDDFDPTRRWAPVETTAARTLRLLSAAAMAGAAIALFSQTMFLSRTLLESFVRANMLSDEDRLPLFVGMVVGAVVAAFAAAVYLSVTRARGHEEAREEAHQEPLDRLEWLIRASRPVLPLALAPSLLTYDYASRAPLVYLALLTVFTLLTEWALRDAFAAFAWPWRVPSLAWPSALRRHLPLLVVTAGALFYAIYFSYYTLQNHHRLGTSAFDLGIHINWSYNALHGEPWRCPVFLGPDGGYYVGAHAIFAMFGWLPLYALKPGGEVLLVYQASIVGAAAIPLYLFGRTQIPRWPAAIVAVLFLFYAPVHGPNFYDFHELLPLPFWGFWLFWAIAKRRNGLVALFVFMLYAHREDVAAGVAVLGLFLVISGARPRLGTVLAAVSTVWFILMKFVIMPRLYHTWFADIYKDLQTAGHPGYGSAVQTILINPSYFLKTLLTDVKEIYFLHVFLPLAFLPLRRPALALLAIPVFFFTLLTTGYAPTVSIAFHYTLHGVPYLFGATILMLRLLSEPRAGATVAPWPALRAGAVRRNAALGAMAGAMLFHSYAYGAIFQHHTFVGGFSKIEFTMTPEEQRRYEVLQKMLKMIPPDASVAASENLVPHIAARRDAYALRFAHGDAEYLLVRRGDLYLTGILKNAFDRHPYGLIASDLGLYLFKRDVVTPGTNVARAELGVPGP
ncbi:MAG TPA: DUF2079 domain-containing protein [Polyangia bacterium]|jgi:uncharacterized membrane protein